MIVEDERDMADLVAMRLKREGYLVETARDGIDGLRRIQSDPPDLVLLDLMLPRMSGTEVATELRSDARTAAVPIIMMTAKSEDIDVVVGLHIGADDYVTKPFSMAVLLARVAAVLRRAGSEGGTTVSRLLRVGTISIDPDRHIVEVGREKVSLTLTEFKLLMALASARGRVLSRNQLMDQAIGVDAVVTDRTIDVHLTALRRKLGDARTYLKTVRGVGYRLTTDETA
jgi:two-component system phosphate regulon response regulator PhoB